MRDRTPYNVIKRSIGNIVLFVTLIVEGRYVDVHWIKNNINTHIDLWFYRYFDISWIKLNINITGISLRKPCGYFQYLFKRLRECDPPKENYLKEKRYNNWFSFISLKTILFLQPGQL